MGPAERKQQLAKNGHLGGALLWRSEVSYRMDLHWTQKQGLQRRPFHLLNELPACRRTERGSDLGGLSMIGYVHRHAEIS